MDIGTRVKAINDPDVVGCVIDKLPKLCVIIRLDRPYFIHGIEVDTMQYPEDELRVI